ncbi:acetylcholinesterase-like [Diadema antillarum]|uniref:acetylcholinesterase-like n=1 Tax=Diadema antillarum TaxID=105358 RepID=UPI003A838454
MTLERVLILVTAVSSVFVVVTAQAPRVQLPDTTLIGTNLEFNETEYLGGEIITIRAFLGIPFAEPPVGDLRFRNPVKKGPLGTFFTAARDGPICPQLSPIDTIGDLLPVPIPVGRNADEDCLYLGVHTASPQPTNAPVLVWFHGGGYTLGGGSGSIYEPLPLIAVSPEIIVVTVNYRLGVFGFLTTGDSASPGNYGMLDQVMALEWVRDNIQYFGGDPSKVTIMGESAGAGSVGLHIVSPLSQGLFHQAIMESGNALCPWAADTNIERQIGFTREIAENFNCDVTDNVALIECLRGVDEVNLTRAQLAMTRTHLIVELLFVPVVDGYFLPAAPATLIGHPDFRGVPTLMGTNEDEGTLIALRAFPSYVVRRVPPPMSLTEFQELFPGYLYYSSPLLIPAVEHWYVDWTKADNQSSDHLDAFIRLNTDQVFACSTELMARALANVSAPVYRYEMTHDPSWSVFAGVPKWLGAGHAEELQYVFGWAFNPSFNRIVGQTDEEKWMSVQFMTYWTNFIRTGDPNSPVSGSYPSWPQFTVPELEYKKLSLTMENGRAMRMESCAFWLNLAPDLYNYTEGDNDDLYDDWQREYTEWRDVHMAEWNEVFNEYKEDNTCNNP